MNWTVLGLLMGLSAVAMADIPFFWLDKPAGRTNKNDPNSPLFVQSVPTMALGSPTFTRTITPTQTMMIFSPTFSPTRSASPTVTPTPTQTQLPACTTTYNFESGVEAWFNGTYDCGVTAIAQNTAMPHCGAGNLALTLDLRTNACGGGGSQRQGDIGVGLGGGVDYSCKILSVWIYVPVGMSNNTNPTGAVLFAKTTGAFNWNPSAWTNLPDTGGWTEVTFDLSAVAQASDTREIGLQIALGGSSPDWAGTIYVDQITLSDKPACVPAQSPTNSPTRTTTPTLTATRTQVPPTPTPTQTDVVVATDWPTVYDGDVAALGTNYYMALETACVGCGGGAVEMTGTGAHGSATYAHVTLAATGYAGAVVFNTGFDGTGPTPHDASSASIYESVEVSVRVPATGNCYSPAVKLAIADNAGTIQWNTKPIGFQAYIIEEDGVASGPVFMEPNKWYTARIPVTAFLGDNGEVGPANHVVVDSDLVETHGVAIQPVNSAYDAAGAFTGEIDVDDVKFTATVSVLNANGRTGLFADFESGTANKYGGYWSANVDPFTAVECPGYVAPPGMPNLSALTFGGLTTTAGGAGTDTPCHVGRLAGWHGNFNGIYGSPPTLTATGKADGYFPYLNMSANLMDGGAAQNLSNNSFIPTLPPTGAVGMRFKLKLGPTLNAEMAGQVVKVFIEKTSAKEGDQFNVQIAVSDLSTSSWQSYDVPFPSVDEDGITPGLQVGTRHADQASEGTVLAWKKTQYAGGAAGSDTFHLTDVLQFGYGSIVRGRAFDVMIDDVEFY